MSEEINDDRRQRSLSDTIFLRNAKSVGRSGFAAKVFFTSAKRD